MGEKCGWPCWEIMNCDASKKCAAKARPDTPCWEIAREMADYRFILQIIILMNSITPVGLRHN